MPGEDNTEPEGYWACEYDPLAYSKRVALANAATFRTCEYCHYITG